MLRHDAALQLLQPSGCRQQAAGCRLQAAGCCRLQQAAACRLHPVPRASACWRSRRPSCVRPCRCSALPDRVESCRPGAVRVPRGRLDRRLAVLLLRSSYEVVDELDATPMDGFQRDFWLERQGTQQAYNDMYPGASASAFSRQGDLTDPLWFDFVCAAQSVVIERSFRASEAVFEEAQGADGTRAVVRRDPSLDRRRLAGAYAERLGARLVAALGPGGWDDNGEVALFGGPAPPARGADGAALLAGVRALAGTLVAHGYCFAASVEPAAAAAAEAAVAAPPGGPAPLSFALRLDGASNLYSAAARARASPPPALAEFAVAAFLRASGRDASWTWRVGPASLGSSWTVT